MSETLAQRVTLVVDAILGPNGLVVQAGGRHEPAQLSYARHVVDALTTTNPKRVSLLEAATGIGKGYGYLVAVLAWIGLSRGDGVKRKAAVSTHTRTLQKVLLQQEIPRIQDHLSALGIPVASIALRMGRRAYLSPRRVQRLVANLLKGMPSQEEANLLTRFEQHVISSCAAGSGLIMDWVDTVGALPKGITDTDICLLDGIEPDNDAFLLARERAKSADLLVTNHASVIMLARGQSSDAPPPWDALVLDEGHLFSSAAESLLSMRFQTREIISALKKLSIEALVAGVKKPLAAAQLAAASLHDTVTALTPPSGSWCMPPSDVEHAVYRHASDLVKTINSVVSGILRDCHEEQLDDTIELLQDVQSIANGLSNWLNPSSGLVLPILQFSERQRLGSLGMHMDAPGGVIKRFLGDGYCRLIITSATLASPRLAGPSFTEIRRELLISQSEVLFEVTLSPQRYGDITRIVRMSDSVPKPVMAYESEVDDERMFELNPVWLDAAASMIHEAYRDGPTLVLCLSHREAGELARRVTRLVPAGTPIFCHDAGQALGDHIADMRRANAGILLTPGAWEGVSLRNMDGGQLIKALVIAHIPYSPVSSMTRDLYLWHASLRGISTAVANGSLQARLQHTVFQRLRQGLGRLIRSPSDSGLVFIADPRFPSPESTQRRVLATAIPERFRARFAESVVFTPGQIGMTRARTPVLIM